MKFKRKSFNHFTKNVSPKSVTQHAQLNKGNKRWSAIQQALTRKHFRTNVLRLLWILPAHITARTNFCTYYCRSNRTRWVSRNGTCTAAPFSDMRTICATICPGINIHCSIRRSLRAMKLPFQLSTSSFYTNGPPIMSALSIRAAFRVIYLPWCLNRAVFPVSFHRRIDGVKRILKEGFTRKG